MQSFAARDVGARVGNELPRGSGAAQLDGRHAFDQLGVLDHHHRIGAARQHAAGGDGGGGAGSDLDLRRMAAGDHLGVERELLWCVVGGARGVGSAQREAVDIGAVERRHVDRRGEIGGEHAAERRRKAHALGGQGRAVDMALEALARFFRRDDFEELLLPAAARTAASNSSRGVCDAVFTATAAR